MTAQQIIGIEATAETIARACSERAARLRQKAAELEIKRIERNIEVLQNKAQSAEDRGDRTAAIRIELMIEALLGRLEDLENEND